MRVLYFTRDYTPHDHRFLTALAESGQETFYLRLERRGRQLEDRPLPSKVQQVPWRGGQKPYSSQDDLLLAADLRRVVRELKPDVVHAGPIQTCAFLCALAGIHPLVSMSWGSDLLVDAHISRRMSWTTRFTLGRSDALVGDCQAVRHAAQGFGMPGERCVLFPWGVDLARFSPRGAAGTSEPDEAALLRERLGWQDAFAILSLRSWEPVYGVDVVVRGFARAAAQEPRLRLFLLGSGSLAGQIQGLLQQEGLHERVRLGGQVSQAALPGYYRAADLYVSASHSDGSSVSLLEALASGLPALVSDIPGNQEWIVPGEAGWLFQDGDADALAAGMLRAARAPETLAHMRPAARALAEQRANWSANFKLLLQAYHMAIDYRGKSHV